MINKNDNYLNKKRENPQKIKNYKNKNISDENKNDFKSSEL